MLPITWIEGKAGGKSVPALSVADYKRLGQNMQVVLSVIKYKNGVIAYYEKCNEVGQP